MRLLAKQAIVVSMATNPEPDESVRHVDGKGSVVGADAHRPEATDFLEMERGMPRILLQARVGLIGEIAYLGRQGPIERPEVGRCVMGQRGLVLPAA
jgi:hypothetical protein